MIYCFDIDGTLCSKTDGDYAAAEPWQYRIAVVNALFHAGNEIKLFTARGSATGFDWRPLTERQMAEWGVRHHVLVMGKPEADLFIDDKAFNADTWPWHGAGPRGVTLKPEASAMTMTSKMKSSTAPSPVDLAQEICASMTAARDTYDAILSDARLQAQVAALVGWCSEALRTGGKVIFAGNGGSFADAQHLAAEFISRLRFDRAPLAAVALGTNSSATTAIANDYGYDQVFAREILAIGRLQDVLIPISTSGRSQNVLAAVVAARAIGMRIVGFTGQSGSPLAEQCECIHIPSDRTERIQEGHILLGHVLCGAVERALFPEVSPAKP